MPHPAQLLAAADALVAPFLDDVKALCRVETHSYDQAALDAGLNHVLDLARRLLGEPASIERIDCAPQGDCAVVTYPGTKPGTAVVLAHYDTVWPVGTLAEWDVVDEPDRLSLPGVFDMKYGLVQGLYALKLLRESGERFPSVVFVFTSDEEIGSPSSRPIIERVCADADATLVLEPSGPGGAMKSGRKGIGIVELTTAGVEAHAGLEPTKGASAIHAMAELITQSVALASPEQGTTINVGMIDGGTGSNVVAGRCRALMDVRVLTADEQARVDAGLRALRVSDDRVAVHVEPNWNRPPMTLTEASRPLLERARAVASELGRELDDITVGGASDANFVAGLGRPVLCGLGGEGSGPHARHERVDPRPSAFRLAFVAGILAGDEPHGQELRTR
ncbi:M20 family metallopeptidase [Nigerium massiliense]|uniref:M20 family metallopeptidase n=1 Tax=Nigerium massiliense TaxID=1522317 RepID=UPI00059079E3|nr:M20 family metallopeptidase [Nigerium massiliense]